MCMGGGQAARIVMPDTGAYDRMAQVQLDAMKAVQDTQSKALQSDLSAALDRQRTQAEQLRDLQIQRANDVSAQASRLATLIGTPPPEKSASAPVTGGSSQRAGAKGKTALRINRPVATTSGAGAGLNIT